MNRTAVSLLGPSLFLLTLVAAPSAQAIVWVVDDDPGPDVDFSTIQSAVNFAADLDMILVRPGLYDRFSVANKALTIHGEVGAIVQQPSFSPIPSPTIWVADLEAAKSVVVRGLTTIPAILPLASSPAARVSNCVGAVFIEDCDLTIKFGEGLEVLNSLAVTVNRCTVSAGFSKYDSFQPAFLRDPGIAAENSNLFLYDSVVTGSVGPDSINIGLIAPTPAGPGGWGITLRGSTLLATGSIIQGGAGGSDNTTMPLCQDGETGGDGLVLEFSGVEPVARLLDTTILPGAGGLAAPGCGAMNGLPGSETVIQQGQVEDLPGMARSFEWDSPVVGGDPFDVTYTGEPGDFVFLLITVGPGPGQYFRDYGAALLIDPFFLNFPIGLLPASGTMTQTATALLPGAVEYARLSAQAAHVSVAGEFFLTGPATLTILQHPDDAQ